MSVLVSVLIPAYNAERWIQESIASALNQSWPHKEVIVVDDGSADYTLEAARKLQAPNVKIVTQQNAGACVARNNALRLAQGDYIQWLDADDLLHPRKIASQLTRCEPSRSSRTLLTSAWGSFYCNTSRARYKPSSLWHDLAPEEWLLHKFLDNVFMNPASWLVSRALIDRAGSWDARLTLDDDGEYVCRLVTKSDRILFVPDALSFYRIGNSSSLSASKSAKAFDSLFLSMTLCIAHLRRLEDSERVRSACVKYLQDNLTLFLPEHPHLVEQSHQLAKELGGVLHAPDERAHFRLARYVLGWERAKHTRAIYSGARTYVSKHWDRLLDRVYVNY